jgi:hypothetical protein
MQREALDGNPALTGALAQRGIDEVSLAIVAEMSLCFIDEENWPIGPSCN